MGVIPCHRGGHECKWPACAQDCDGRPGRDAAEKQWTQQQIDDHMFDDDDVVCHLCGGSGELDECECSAFEDTCCCLNPEPRACPECGGG